MTTSLDSAIVRIRASNGSAVGTGFLATDRHVLTCAHVVTGALGLAGDAQVENPGFFRKNRVRVRLDFPLLAAESALTARVSHWQPDIDVAMLELTSDSPAKSKPVRLVTADDLWGHSFRAFGFPVGYEQGVWASGVLRGRQADGWLQIEDTKETGYLIAPGFSGGPVWDDVLGGVVGMIVAADTDEKVKAAFLIPADILAETLPDLVHAYVEWAQAQLDADMDQLRTRRDQADEARREMRARQRVVNLRPLDVTHTFKDRVREVQALCDYLTDSSVRLVSVVGRGGMGKTALVSRVLGDLERGVLPVLGESGEKKDLHIDGILYLGARSTGLGLERIYADVGRMLGEPAASMLEARWADRSMPLTAKIEYLLEAVQDGLYLILLDNLEGVMAEDGIIMEESLRFFVECCLTQPSGVRLIATSREQVKVSVAALHGARSIPLCAGLPEYEAVALLRDLDPQGMLGLRDALEEDLQRAAQLTQGIPRALEILVGILHEEPTASLSRLMADEGLFDAQVVGQLIAAGYSRLGETERRVMEALAVFDRPVEETAVVYLLHPWWPGLDVRARLHRLVRGYFVSVNRVTGKYSHHPLDRDHAYRQIPSVIDEDKGPGSYNRRNLELRAAEFYASIRKPEGEWQTIDDLEPQLAEFEHRVRAGDYDGACSVLELVDSDYMLLWGHYTRLVELREKLLGQLTDPHLRVANLGGLGNAYRALGQVERAIGYYEEALAVARKVGDRQAEGAVLGRLGSAYRVLGQFEWASELYEKALDIAREMGDRREEGIQLSHLGLAYRALGQVERAINLYEEALAIAREINDRRGEGANLFNLGRAYRALGQIERAIDYYEEALAIARQTGYRRGEGIDLGYLGLACCSVGQIERAIQLYEEALAIAREIGDRWNEGVWLSNLGFAYSALGQVERAISYYEDALAIACEIGDRRGEDIQIGHLGSAYRVLGQLERAIMLHQQALVIAREIGNRWGESYQLLDLGKALLTIGELANAYQCCQEALELNVLQTAHLAALMLGIVLLHRGEPAARDAFADAAAHCRVRLDRTASLYRARYTLAMALAGQAVCDPRWPRAGERAALLAPALAEYRRALEICSALGVVQDALRDLELIRAAGIEGLEPVFELLEEALCR
jgi:tetratricopeptide (TPR) repeat protein